jgi:hypothetical protein
MAKRVGSSLAERQRCAIKFCVPWSLVVQKPSNKHQFGSTNILLHRKQIRMNPSPESCGKRSAARLRKVGGALQEVHRLTREE